MLGTFVTDPTQTKARVAKEHVRGGSCRTEKNQVAKGAV